MPQLSQADDDRVVKRLAKRAIARLLPVSSRARFGVRILLYHAIDQPDPADRLGLRVAPEAFRAQITWLRSSGYRVVPLRSLLEACDDQAPRVAITFDDGYRSQLVAASILEEFRCPATFFVVPRWLDGDRSGNAYWEDWEHFGWDEAQRLVERGFEIGAHSATHVRLTQCPLDRLPDEVGGAKRRLEERLGCMVASFSYPHGDHDERVVETVRAAGYRLACTSVSGANYAPWSWLRLRRTEISGADRPIDFQHKLEGRYDWLGRWQFFRQRVKREA